jgi:hypothetical protein
MVTPSSPPSPGGVKVGSTWIETSRLGRPTASGGSSKASSNRKSFPVSRAGCQVLLKPSLQPEPVEEQAEQGRRQPVSRTSQLRHSGRPALDALADRFSGE